jgi:hypothetical protein
MTARPVASCSVDEGLGVVERERERLFDQHVTARAQRRERHRRVIRGRDEHADDVRDACVEQRVDVPESPGNAEAIRDLCRAPLVVIRDGDHLGAAHAPERGQMFLGADLATANQRDPERTVLSARGLHRDRFAIVRHRDRVRLRGRRSGRRRVCRGRAAGGGPVCFRCAGGGGRPISART